MDGGLLRLWETPRVPLTARAPSSAVSAAVGPATAVLVAALLAASAAAGVAASALVAVVLGAALAVGWPTLLALPSPRGTTGVVAATGVAAALAVATTPGEPGLRRLPVVLALGVLAACGHQLLRRDLRPRVVDSLGGTLLGAGLAALAAGWVALPATGGWSLTLVAAASAVSACLLLALPLRAGAATAVAALAAVAVGAAVGALGPGAGAPWGASAGAVVGAVVAVVVAGLHHLLAPLPAAGRLRSRVALVVGPLAAAGTAAQLVGGLLVGGPLVD